MAKLKTYEDYIEDSTMRELHRIREQLDREQRESGLSYFEWFEATDKDLRQSLAEVSFEIVTRDGRTFLDEIGPRTKKNNGKYKTVPKGKVKRPLSPKLKKAKYPTSDDYKENSTMREIHRIQQEMEQQFKKSGFSSYDEWLQATENDFQKSLAEDGFHMVTRNGETFIEEINPQTKSKQPISKIAKHKNYDDYIEDSTMQKLHLIREKMEQEYRKSGLASYEEWLQATEPNMRQSLAEVGFEIVTRDGRTFLDKIKSQSKKRVKYKTVSTRSKTNVRKK